MKRITIQTDASKRKPLSIASDADLIELAFTCGYHVIVTAFSVISLQICYQVPPVLNSTVSEVIKFLLSTVYSPTSLSIMLFNARSLLLKIHNLRAVSAIAQPSVICVTETLLTDETPDTAISLPGYDIHRSDRKNYRGGGCAIYSKTELRATLFVDSSLEGIPETTWISTERTKRPVLSPLRMPFLIRLNFCWVPSNPKSLSRLFRRRCIPNNHPIACLRFTDSGPVTDPVNIADHLNAYFASCYLPIPPNSEPLLTAASLQTLNGQDTMVAIFKLCVRPIVEFCPALSSLYTGSCRLAIESVKRSFTKKLFPRSHPLSYRSRCQILGLEPLWLRRLKLNLTLLHRLLHKDTFIAEARPNINSQPHYRLRNSCNLLVCPPARTNLRHYFFLVYYARIWNSLPE
ncbi:reverse transcriptase SjR1 [Clonorchis sinensis]|uniref:Reverse transcriptase SjR1 n=1 Tax=Clonorchis sinensis TaxID=79923 RepID=G7Y7R9_CLOSI|nr:reverse transcriptase SjR1 [Clonorchis sinensis]